MTLGQALLNEDRRAAVDVREHYAMQERRAAFLVTQGDCDCAIVAALQKHGPMTRNLLILALPDRQPSTVSRIANRMIQRAVLIVEERGPIEVLRIARVPS